jgi:molybdopterin-guanine dinucleotide biosynthesis protein A
MKKLEENQFIHDNKYPHLKTQTPYYSLTGAPCSYLKEWVANTQLALKPARILWIDQEHDQQDHSQHDYKAVLSGDHFRLQAFSPNFSGGFLPDFHLHLFNGNHFEKDKQILFLHEKKIESTLRKIDRLNDVAIVIQCQDHLEIPDPLQQFIQDRNVRTIRADDFQAWIYFISENLPSPPLKALLLGGGRSKRMGTDKLNIQWRDKPHWQRVRELFDEIQLPLHLSIRADQLHDPFFSELSVPLVADRISEAGPVAAIISAQLSDPTSAWLVLACDLPLMGVDELKHLIHKRNSYYDATSFYNEQMGFHEPLAAIWEPHTASHVMASFARGIQCPRKILGQCNVKSVIPLNAESILNANTPEDRTNILSLLKHSQKDQS